MDGKYYFISKYENDDEKIKYEVTFEEASQEESIELEV